MPRASQVHVGDGRRYVSYDRLKRESSRLRLRRAFVFMKFAANVRPEFI